MSGARSAFRIEAVYWALCPSNSKFKEAARDLASDEDEGRRDEQLSSVAGPQPAPEKPE